MAKLCNGIKGIFFVGDMASLHECYNFTNNVSMNALFFYGLLHRNFRAGFLAGNFNI